ncbi:MAG: nucleotide exchange factor GrpE [Bacteroidetes bacterium]|nr:nucleotide exchange factor GrpE [Bacteroidota bacterium]
MTTEKMSDVQEKTKEKDTMAQAKDQKQKKSGKKDSKKDKQAEELEETKIQLQEQKDKFLRLFAEFDNYKKRTAKERLELIRTAGQDIISELLPVLDDFDRAEKAITDNDDIKTAREGFSLIKEKLFKKLESKGLEHMDSMGKEFDPDLHEAITEIPAPNEELKGKVVDVIEKGYNLGQKIIRYAKVVVGK